MLVARRAAQLEIIARLAPSILLLILVPPGVAEYLEESRGLFVDEELALWSKRKDGSEFPVTPGS